MVEDWRCKKCEAEVTALTLIDYPGPNARWLCDYCKEEAYGKRR